MKPLSLKALDTLDYLAAWRYPKQNKTYSKNMQFTGVIT